MEQLVTVDEASRILGVSVSTVWRRIRSGELPSVRRNGRRCLPRRALERPSAARDQASIPDLTPDHPIFRLVGAGRGGGTKPGARQKHRLLDR
jgi:excisionase family DNA binding protein